MLVGYVWLRAYNVNGDWYPFKGIPVPDETTSLILGAADGRQRRLLLHRLPRHPRWQQSDPQHLRHAGAALDHRHARLAVPLHGRSVFGTSDGGFASEWTLLSGYHIYHLLIGTFLGLGLVNRAWRGRYSATKNLGVTTIGYFWYWMAATPVLVWLLMTLLPPKI